MKFKDKLFLLPYFIIFFIDLTVIVFFIAYLFSGVFQWTKLLYVFLILTTTTIIYFLRIGVIGTKTVLDRFSPDKNFGKGLTAVTSLVMSILIVTFLIAKTRWSIFINDFQKLDFDPLKWFEFLNNNYQQIVLYASLVVVISIILMVPIILFSKFLSKESEEGLIKIMTTIGMAIIFLLFTSNNVLIFWRSIFDIKIIQQILTYLFSGSLIYFNLFFLLKRPSD